MVEQIENNTSKTFKRYTKPFLIIQLASFVVIPFAIFVLLDARDSPMRTLNLFLASMALFAQALVFVMFITSKRPYVEINGTNITLEYSILKTPCEFSSADIEAVYKKGNALRIKVSGRNEMGIGLGFIYPEQRDELLAAFDEFTQGDSLVKQAS